MYEQDTLLNNCFMLTVFSTQLNSWYQLMSVLISMSTCLLLINKCHKGNFWSTLIHVLMITMEIVQYCSSLYKLFCACEQFSRIVFSNCQSPLQFSKTSFKNVIFIRCPIEYSTFQTLLWLYYEWNNWNPLNNMVYFSKSFIYLLYLLAFRVNLTYTYM